jgi:hypothetical protein
LEHLTSLKLWGVAINEDTIPSGQQQQLEGAVVQSAPGEQQQLAHLRAMSTYTRNNSSWFAFPSLETLDVTFYCCGTSLAQLAGCHRLQQLRVKYDSCFSRTTGVSVLTQLKRLRLETAFVAPDELRGLGAELAALEQLQELEVPYEHLVALQPHDWLPQLRSLTMLGALEVKPTRLQPLQHLAAALPEGCGSSNSSSSSGSHHGSSCSAATPVPTSSSSGSGSSSDEQATSGAPTVCVLQRLVLTLHGWDSEGTRRARPVLQQEADSITAAHPGLQVEIRPWNVGTYTCPCWTVEAERQRHNTQS